MPVPNAISHVPQDIPQAYMPSWTARKFSLFHNRLQLELKLHIIFQSRLEFELEWNTATIKISSYGIKVHPRKDKDENGKYLFSTSSSVTFSGKLRIGSELHYWHFALVILVRQLELCSCRSMHEMLFLSKAWIFRCLSQR